VNTKRSAWKRYVELRPDELAATLAETPVAFWPLGLIEHHGWHLPIGLDGIKAERFCIRVAENTGGLLLPTFWWGASGGHGDFLWTHYQSEAAAESILATTTEQLSVFGFRVIVILAGHYPWQDIMDRSLPAIQKAHPETLLLWGTEISICKLEVPLPGDHASREETSYGLFLLPELVDMDALRPGRDDSVWPGSKPPALEGRHPQVRFDPSDPLFAQAGVDARLASASRGADALTPVINQLTVTIERWLETPTS
jgi:creatinine amidohydrolase